MNFKRIFVIVIDSLGIGAMRDAEKYGDAGADTLGHIAEHCPRLAIPALQKLGLANLHRLSGIPPVEKPAASFMRLNEKSAGKDTMTGHWEMMGLYVDKPFRTFSEHGFPPELIAELERRTGRRIIGNKSASGTEILKELGEEEIRHNCLIVYTSADSVLQICGNEETMGLETLYRYCEIARALTLREDWRVGRVIARPYVGKSREEFRRTANRRDYALKPSGRTVLDALKSAGLDVLAVGKIQDIFSGQGITEAWHSESSVHGMEQTMELAGRDFCGLCFTNLVDFDALWGHRRDGQGYGKELERFDRRLSGLLKLLKEDDLLMITADHGNDPVFRGTDHTREQTPLLLYSPSLKQTKNLGESDTFAVVGATAADNFRVPMPEQAIGTSVLRSL